MHNIIFLLFLCRTAEFLTSQSRSEEAIFYRIRAAELAPDDYALVVAAATALRLSERKAEAESWYRKVSHQANKKNRTYKFKLERIAFLHISILFSLSSAGGGDASQRRACAHQFGRHTTSAGTHQTRGPQLPRSLTLAAWRPNYTGQSRQTGRYRTQMSALACGQACAS